MIHSRILSHQAPLRALWHDRVFRVALLLWLLVALPYFLPLLSTDQLSIHSEFGIEMILLPVALAAVLAGVQSLGSGAERKFWYFIGAALTAMWFATFGYWTPPDRVSLFLLIDSLYLAFYMMLGLAALSAPHRKARTAPEESRHGVMGVALILLCLATYFVLVPGTYNAERYTTWLPSMYLFQILDLFVLALFARSFREAKATRWRAIYALMAAALAIWAILDFIEGLSWAGVVRLPVPGLFNLVWTLPLAIVVVAARVRHAGLEVEPEEHSTSRGDSREEAVSHVALIATVAFPLGHFAFAISGLLDPTLNSAREVVVVVAIMVLGATAFVERARAVRTRRRERLQRETAESALRESEARYRTLVEHAPEAIVILDPATGRFIDSNNRALELFKLTREELLNQGPGDLSPHQQPDGRNSAEVAKQRIERVMGGEVLSFDWVHQDSEGRPVHCEVYLVALPSGGKKLIRGSMVDVTDRLALRAQLHESRRMEAIGRLAGGVAHDFNNLLTVIAGYSDLALENPTLAPTLQQMILEIKKAGSKAADLTRQLLAFSRRQEMELQPLDLNQIITDLEALLRRLLGEDLSLDIRLDPMLGRIRADRAQIEQVIVNLAVNGRDAMPEGGLISIETSSVELEAPLQQGSVPIPAGRYGRLALRDNGIGMDEITKRRVFEPFFTTKRFGAGTGLGLATVYGIVTQSAGYVTVDSAPNEGSTFAVHFPLAPVETSLLAEPHPESITPRGHERILFVEDEESIRSLQCTGLRALGYNVLSARDADHALSLLAQNSDDVEVLVSDVVLPGLSGPDLAEQILLINPDIKVIFVSGYTDDLIRRKGKLAEETPFLQKPFSPIDLARKIRGVVEAA
jgi:PAS domain S-box-containing protein